MADLNTEHERRATMKFSTKKRLAIGASALATVGAVTTLVAGMTFGLFSATTPVQSNTFTAGKVSFGTPGGLACNVANAQPGDSGTCTLQETYNGTASSGAYLGLDVAITGASGTPVAPYSPTSTLPAPTAANGLYDGTVNGLQVEISDGQATPVYYMNANGAQSGAGYNVAGTYLGGSATTSGSASASAADLLVNTTPFTSSTTITWTVNWSLPSSAGNAYDGATTTIALLVHAVQAGNQTFTGSCAVGKTCGIPANWS